MADGIVYNGMYQTPTNTTTATVNGGQDPNAYAQGKGISGTSGAGAPATYSFEQPSSNWNQNGSYVGMPLQSDVVGATHGNTQALTGFQPTGMNSYVSPGVGQAAFQLSSGIVSNDSNANNRLLGPDGREIATWSGAPGSAAPSSVGAGYAWKDGQIVVDPTSQGGIYRDGQFYQNGTGGGGGAAGGGNSSTGAGIVGGAQSGGNGGMTPWNVTSGQTVEGRIASILNPNNPIIAQARAGATDVMNDRGLANSDLAISAADDAAYRAAVPIAQADAATFAKAAGYSADIQNQMAMQQKQLASNMGIAQLQSGTQKQIAQLNSDTTRYTANLDAKTRSDIQSVQNQNQLLIQTNSQAATIFNQAVAAISTIQNNDKMDAASKTQAIANLMQNVNSQLQTMSKASGVNVSLNLGNYPGFDAHGNYVGFNPDGSTRTAGSGGTTTTPMSQNPFRDATVTNEGQGGGP